MRVLEASFIESIRGNVHQVVCRDGLIAVGHLTVPRLTAFNPPTLRAFGLKMSYRLYRDVRR